MDIHTQLKELGMNNTEISIYLYLLENGLSSPPQIAKGTKISRTNCYNILQSLKEKELIEEQRTGKRKAYLASDPEALLRSIERKKGVVTRVLPDLRGLYTTQKNKPKIQFYDGIEQIKEIYWQTLSAKEIYGIGSTNYLHNLIPDFFSLYIYEIKKRNIIFHDLLTHSSGEVAGPLMQNALKGLYDVTYLPPKYQNFPTDILIWEHRVALITLESPIFGTVLTNPQLATTFQIVFRIMSEVTTPNQL